MGFWIGSQDGLLRELRSLKEDVAKLSGERDALKKERNLHTEAMTLREQIETLKIEKARLTEEHDRKERDVRHEVGLLRKQVEAETELATQEAVLKVREENLKADRDRFEEQMKFTTARFEKEVEYLHDIAGKLLVRLPTVEVNKRIVEGVAAGSNGHSKDDDE